jgi:hypothetical protein
MLDARLGRLAAAADEAVAAAQDADVATLRRHLRKFEVLTSALWTVQLSCPPRPRRRPRPAVTQRPAPESSWRLRTSAWPRLEGR